LILSIVPSAGMIHPADLWPENDPHDLQPAHLFAACYFERRRASIPSVLGREIDVITNLVGSGGQMAGRRIAARTCGRSGKIGDGREIVAPFP
jgi:hypothetical protein